MATKVYNVKAPDGSIVKVRGPEGASQEEVINQAKKLFAQRAAPAPEPVAPAGPTPEEAMAADQAKRGTTLSSLLGQYGEIGREISPITLGGRALEAMGLEGAEQAAGDFQQGAIGGFGNMVEGIRQGANKLMGDDEELALLNRDTEMRKAKLAEMTKQNPGLASAGEMLGEAVPGMLAGGALAKPLSAVRGLANPVGRVLASGAGGAAGGYASALTPEQEAAGARSDNALIGGALGGAAGALGPTIAHLPQNISRTMKSVLPEDAVPDFLRKTTGLTEDTAKTYSDILRKTGVQKKATKEMVDSFYDVALKSPGADFPVPLHALDRLTDVSRTPVTEEIFNSKDAVRDILNTARIGRTTPGATQELPFPKVAQAIKELNDIAADPARKGSAAADTAEALARDLRERVKFIGDVNPDAKPIIDMHEVAQDLYKTKRVPMEKAGEGAPIGTWAEGGSTEKDFSDIFLSQKSGKQLEDFFERVPEAEGDVRKLWATTKSGQPEFHRDLAPSTTRDTIFKDPAEREYASKLAKELRRREEKGGDILSKIGYRMSGQYGPILNMLLSDKAARGIMQYGVDPKNFTNADKMRAALMSSALLNSGGDE